MLYESYERKVRRYVSFLKFIQKYKFIIMAVFTVVFSSITGYGVSKGRIIDVSIPENIVFGETYEIQSTALFSNVTYTYRINGGASWGHEKPIRAGHYEVRLSTTQFMGRTQHKIYAFSILPQTVELTIVDDEITFGDEPRFLLSLYPGDVIQHIEFLYEDLTQSETLVTIGTYTIVDRHGLDVSASYDVVSAPFEISFLPRHVIIGLKSSVQVYNGLPFQAKNFEFIEGGLGHGHRLDIQTSSNIVSVGQSANQITSLRVWFDDIEVTSHYRFETVDGLVEVTPKPLKIATGSLSKIYDATSLSDPSFEIIEGSLVSGHRMEVKDFEQLTHVGRMDNRMAIDILDSNGHDVSHNYEVTYQYGQLEVEQRPLSLVTLDGIKTYDGLSFNHIEFSISEGLLPVNHQLQAMSLAQAVDVGVYQNQLDFVIMNGMYNVTQNFKLDIEFGTLQIQKRPIELITEHQLKTYDATALYHTGYQVVSGTFVLSHTLMVHEWTELVDVGKVENQLSFKVLNDVLVDVTHNYLLMTSNGYLEVFPRTIHIKPVDRLIIYDGKSHTALQAEVIDGWLPNHHHIDIETNASNKNVGTTVTTILSTRIYEHDREVTHNYVIHHEQGMIEVSRRPISVETLNDTKIFDGTPLFNTELLMTQGSMVEHQSFTVDSYTSITYVGEATNALQLRILDIQGDDVSSNYEMTLTFGLLKITQRMITVKPVDLSKVYDGLELFSHQVETISLTQLVNGHHMTAINIGRITDVGIEMNQIHALTIWHGDQEMTPNYLIIMQSGTLEVLPRPITLVTGTGLKIYDDQPLSVTEYTLLQSSLVEGHQIDIVYTTSIQYVKSVENILRAEVIRQSDGILMSHNYEITYIYGSLTVVPRPITIQTHSAQKVYDGMPFSQQGYHIIEGSLVSNHETVITTITEITDVKQVDNILLIDVYHSNGLKLTENYDVSYVYGTLTITKRLITIESSSRTKVFDGLPLISHTHEVIEGSLVSGHITYVVLDTEITYVGEKENLLSIDIYDAHERLVTHNYEISYVYGLLSITPRQISIVTASDSKVYDGIALFNKQLNVYEGSLVADHVTVVTAYTTRTYVGIEQNIIELIIIDQEGIDRTINYHVTISYGNLEILHNHLTIKPKDEAKPYDRMPLTGDIAEVIDGHLPWMHQIMIETEGSQTELGESLNEITLAMIFHGEVDVTFNFILTFETGILKVVPRPIEIETGTSQKPFDNTPLSNQNHVVIGGSLLDGHRTHVVTFTEITDLGEIDNLLEMIVLDDENIDVSHYYEMTWQLGILKITPRMISVSTPSAKKVYDGTPLTKPEWHISSGSLVGDHQIFVTVTGTITEIGETFNSFTYDILDGLEQDVSHYYIVSNNLGILKIEPFRFVLMIGSGSDSKDYDGLPLTNEEWYILDGDLLLGHVLEVEVTGTITDIGSTRNTFTWAITNHLGEDVTSSYYDVQPKYGKLTIFGLDGNGDNFEDGSPISREGMLADGDEMGVVFKVFSAYSDVLYLRDKSYGDYLKSGFAAPPIYSAPDGNNPLRFPSFTLNQNVVINQIQIQAIASGLSYFLPYYAIDGFYGNINDVYLSHRYGLGYTVNHVRIDDMNVYKNALENTDYALSEMNYREFVYDHYLNLPIDTKAKMLEIASRNGIDSNSAHVISEVQQYIQQAAIYNLKFKPIPNDVDFAVYFLEESREGICQHFAMAGVVMYRALGIPARYVIGYAASVEKEVWTEVTVNQLHAWVEVYIDGFGWMPVEVTGGGPEGSGLSRGRGGSGQRPDDESHFIDITSMNASKIFDGTALLQPNFYYEGQLKDGHELVVINESSIVQVGEVYNVFNVIIYDQYGHDVTSQYDIRKHYGLLVVVPNNDKPIIEVNLYHTKKIYNDDMVKQASTDYWIPEFQLSEGYYVTFDVIGEIKDVGLIYTSVDRGTFRLFDANHLDITHRYNIVFYEGSIEVIKRNLSITAFSAEKYEDGEPLVFNQYYVSQGTQVLGHELHVTIHGMIDEVGTIENRVLSVIIYNAAGEDVTKNYNLKTFNGLLTIKEN